MQESGVSISESLNGGSRFGETCVALLSVLLLVALVAGSYAFVNRDRLRTKRNEALVLAAREGGIARMQMCLLLGADANTKVGWLGLDGWGGIQATRPLTMAAANGQIQAIDFLLANGADINLIDEFGSPLAHAAFSGQKEAVERLLVHGADINAGFYDWTDTTPLTAAVSGNQVEMTDLLLMHGAGNSLRANAALWLAVKTNNQAIIRSLLAACVDLLAKNDDGVTVLEYAQTQGHVEIVRLLSDAEKQCR